MSVTIVVAYSKNRVIGNAGTLPWHLPSDLQRFKGLTLGHAVIMGRKTYESLPEKVRPLPGRTNVVISRNLTFAPGGDCLVANSMEEALSLADSDPVFVIGGEQIYDLALPLADQVIVTRVESYITGDCHFPSLGEDWELESGSKTDFENGFTVRHLVYNRRA